MLWTVVLILLALWVFGLLLKIAGALIHLLLLVVVVVLIFRFLTRSRST